jgi:hypothetical protein
VAPAATGRARVGRARVGRGRTGLGGTSPGSTVRGRLVGAVTVRAMQVRAAGRPGGRGRRPGNVDTGNPAPTTTGRDHGTTDMPTAPRPIAHRSIAVGRRLAGHSSVAPVVRRARGSSTGRPAVGVQPTVIVARTPTAAANARPVNRDRRSTGAPTGAPAGHTPVPANSGPVRRRINRRCRHRRRSAPTRSW